MDIVKNTYYNSFLQNLDVKGWAFVERDIPHKKVAYWNLINQYAYWLGIPPELVAAIQIRETGWMPIHRRATAISPAGARGVQQVMPYHAKKYGYKPDELFDPHVNVEISCKILRDFYLNNDKDVEKVIELMEAQYDAEYGYGFDAIDCAITRLNEELKE